jgi:hypothetical protein
MSKRRQGFSHAISSIIKELEEKYHWKEKKYGMQVATVWDKCMDKDILQNTQKVFMQGKILYVSIKSPTLRLKLQMNSHLYLAKIHQEMEDDFVSEIRFV